MSRSRTDLAAVVSALDTLAEQGGDLIGQQHLDEVTDLRARIQERVRHGDALTVVAVAGGTGAGKSALVNRIARAPVTTEGVRRPTTNDPVAVAGGFDESGRALLDHLEIHDRRVVDSGLPSELILVDLPDHDSVVESHRTTSARLAARVDALVVVVDPVKYARADLHHGPLADLTRHAEVVTVVLNRSDELSDEDLECCRIDLAARLAADGLERVGLLTTSAATGEGIEPLREHLERLAGARSAAVRRLIADAAQLADRIALDAGEPAEVTGDADRLLEPLLEATDAYRSAAEASAAYRLAARRGSRSPLARGVGVAGGVGSQLRRAFVPTQPPPPPPVRSTAIIEAVLARHLELAHTTGREHAALAATINRIATDAAPQVIDAVDGVPLRPDHRGWWTGLAMFRGVAEAVALAGLVWLVLIGVADWLGLPDVPAPEANDVLMWPAALFLYGLAARVVLGVTSRLLAAAGARRHGRRVSRLVRRRLASALDDHVVEAIEDEMRRRRTVREQLEALSHGDD